MTAGKGLRTQRVNNDGLLSLELMERQFGSLRIISREVHGSSWKARVKARCECGAVHWMLLSNLLKRGGRVGCPSCKVKEPITVPRWLYRRCNGQQQRCQNPNNPCYLHYGGRGIQFNFSSINSAARWVVENLGLPSSQSMQLDRINNDGHYEPGNLRWVTAAGNANNRRVTRQGKRERTIAFRANHPEIKYADSTLYRLMDVLTDEQIIERFHQPSCKPKGRYGTYSIAGLYKDSPPTVG